MKYLIRIPLLLLAVFAITYIGNMAIAQQSEESTTSTTTVQRFSDYSPVDEAWSTLTRYESGVVATFSTNELTPNDVVTMWWVVFNAPENCSDACGEDDLFRFDDAGELVVGENGAELNFEQIEAAEIALIGGTGSVINEDGTGNFSAVLSASENPNTVFGPSLTDPMGAEIHLVLRTHGEVNEETLAEQLILFNGGCDVEFPNEPCQDLQFAVHIAN